MLDPRIFRQKKKRPKARQGKPRAAMAWPREVLVALAASLFLSPQPASGWLSPGTPVLLSAGACRVGQGACALRARALSARACRRPVALAVGMRGARRAREVQAAADGLFEDTELRPPLPKIPNEDVDEGSRRDVVTVSPEFTALCQAQFEVLASVVGASRCHLYFRREDPSTGRLEFVPAVVYPEKQRVWVVGEGPTGLPSSGAMQLAGFIPATSLLPEYPFVKTKREGGPSSSVVEIEDGGLSVPIEYNSIVLGMLAVWRDSDAQWTEAERSQVQGIATSLAIAVVLDQRNQWQEAVQAESLRKMLSETLHQVKNSLSAMRMFGKLLLRRLPGNDKMNRELAKDILIQSDRLVDLLLPIDSLTRLPSLSPSKRPPSFLLQQAQETPERGGTGTLELLEVSNDGAGSEEDVQVPSMEEDETLQKAVEVLERTRNEGGVEKAGTCGVEQALEPIISAGQAIAEFDGIVFEHRVAKSLPQVYADTRVLQEAVSNVLDNALKYVLVRGNDPSHPRVSFEVHTCRSPLDGVELVVTDNGAGVEEAELPMLCEEGFRGQRCAQVPGTGLGLHIARKMLDLMGGEMLLEQVSAGSGLRVRIQLRRVTEGNVEVQVDDERMVGSDSAQPGPNVDEICIDVAQGDKVTPRSRQKSAQEASGSVGSKGTVKKKKQYSKGKMKSKRKTDP